MRRVRRGAAVRGVSQEAADEMIMRTRLMSTAAAVALAAAIGTIHAAGQTRPAAKGARTPDGHPDLTGVYDLATLTPVERPTGRSATLTDEEAAKLEKQAARPSELRGVPSET